MSRSSCDYCSLLDCHAISRKRDSRETAGARKASLQAYRIFVVNNRERDSHAIVTYFWVARKESPTKLRWPSDDKEVVDKEKSSEMMLAVGRRGCR